MGISKNHKVIGELFKIKDNFGFFLLYQEIEREIIAMTLSSKYKNNVFKVRNEEWSCLCKLILRTVYRHWLLSVVVQDLCNIFIKGLRASPVERFYLFSVN